MLGNSGNVKLPNLGKSCQEATVRVVKMKGCAKHLLTLGLSWHIVPHLEQHTLRYISQIQNKMQKSSLGNMNSDTIITKNLSNKDIG